MKRVKKKKRMERKRTRIFYHFLHLKSFSFFFKNHFVFFHVIVFVVESVFYRFIARFMFVYSFHFVFKPELLHSLASLRYCLASEIPDTSRFSVRLHPLLFPPSPLLHSPHDCHLNFMAFSVLITIPIQKALTYYR